MLEYMNISENQICSTYVHFVHLEAQIVLFCKEELAEHDGAS